MGRDRKKHEKEIKRAQKVADRRKQKDRIEYERRRRDQYPNIEIDPTNGDSEFVELVRVALSNVDFDNPAMFTDWERATYRLMRQRGWGHALFNLQEAMQTAKEKGDPFGDVGTVAFILGLGTNLLNQLPEDTRRRLMPYNDMRVDFTGQKIILRFSSMLAQMGSGGTIYYSRRQPKLNFHGKQWTVAFSRHAIERICERLNPRYLNYSAAGDIHAYFSNCVYFEPILLYGNQPAFTFYDMCGERPFVHYSTYVEGILGKENVDPSKGECYYRVGYCPVVFEDVFAKAKTFLYPGYTNTPEYGLVLKARLSQSEKGVLIHQATSQDATEVILNDSPAAIKWFHDYGVPQVVQIKEDVFIFPKTKTV